MSVGMGKQHWRILALHLSILLLIPALTSAQAVGKLEINDPYTNGTASGSVSGGVFTSNGWKTTARTDYIQYDIETCPFGKVEFDVKGLYASNNVFPNIGYNKRGEQQEDVHYTLFNMWDRDDDRSWWGKTINGIPLWHNPYKAVMHLFGYVVGDRYKWGHGRFRLNVSAFEGGYDDDPHAFEVDWGPEYWQQDSTYHFTLEWGEGAMSYYVNGKLWAKCDYSSFGEEYAPPDHSLRVGSSLGCLGFGFQVPIGITFSDFKFYRYVDDTPPQVTDYSPDDGTTVGRSPYIAIVLNEAIKLETARTAFSISPNVAGTLNSAGSSIYFAPDELLPANTTFTVSLSTDLQDNAGNSLEQPFSFSFTTLPEKPTRVGKYKVFDLPIVASISAANKYTDVTLKGIFRGPTQTIEIEGFWDGGNVWRVRMAPTEVGTWTYTITSPYAALQTSGSFECVESDSKGFLRKNPDHPYTFMYDDGTPWMWKGETSWRATTSVIPYEGRWKPYIDLRAEQGYNAVQHILVSYINGDAFWKNEGGYVFDLTTSGKNYDKLNPDYFKWVDVRYEYALSKGIVPVILFTWAQEFAKFTTAQFDRYAKYLVARYAAYNVIWVLSGEYDEVYVDFGMTPDIWEHHGNVVYNADPYKHPITLHPTGRSSSREFGSRPWMGLVMQQGPYWHRDIIRDRVYQKPVVNGEYAYAGWHADEDVRIGAWECMTAGGFITAGFFNTFAPDKGGWDMESYAQQQNEVKWALAFMESTKWWAMNPHDELVSNGYCLAIPGEEYVVYSRSGGAVTINLSHATEDLMVEWLNPRTGQYSSRSTVAPASSVTLSPPFTGDWVLHIGTSFNRDVEPPQPPTGLEISKR